MRSLRYLFVGGCLALVLGTVGMSQVVISNLGALISYSAPVTDSNQVAAIFEAGTGETRLTGVTLQVQQTGVELINGTFAVSLWLADNTTHAPIGAALATDTLNYSLQAPAHPALAFSGSAITHLSSVAMISGTHYALVVSSASDPGFSLITSNGLAPYSTDAGFVAVATRSSSNDGASWGTYGGGSKLIYSISVEAIPEPSAVAMFAGAVALMHACLKRRRRR